VPKSLFDAVTRDLGLALDQHFELVNRQRLGGGDINQAFQLDLGSMQVFLKCNSSASPVMFETEARGLTELASFGDWQVPEPLALGQFESTTWLAMDFLALDGQKQQGAHAMGINLAKLHQHQQSFFGWLQDNYIGSTPQPNPRCEQWLEFYGEHRLRFQVDRLVTAGATKRLSGYCESLVDRLPELFQDHKPHPSLLHGDLWAGNWAVTATGRPATFDPACYYGDRETDLAMTELFGGFPAAFYQAYEQTFPIDPGYPQRKPLYQLYHVLNHANLFGGGYLAQAEQMLHHLVKR
jgi:protein-ribulosamine 3-kinase